MHYLLENAPGSEKLSDASLPLSCIAHVVCGLSLRKVSPAYTLTLENTDNLPVQEIISSPSVPAFVTTLLQSSIDQLEIGKLNGSSLEESGIDPSHTMIFISRHLL